MSAPRSARLVLALALAASVVSPPAFAAPDAPAAAADDARANAGRAFAEGSKAYKAGNFRAD